MNTINTNYVLPENKKLAALINDLGELLARENLNSYEEVVTNCFNLDKRVEPEEEKKFLEKLYSEIVNKLKELKF